jgi:hypothetical protein
MRPVTIQGGEGASTRTTARLNAEGGLTTAIPLLLAVESKEDSVRVKIGMSIALFAALLVTAATPAFAAPKTVVIDGREYGPKDGLQVDTQQFIVKSGSGPITVVFGGPTSTGSGSVTPMTTTNWGSSYAISNEWWTQLGYDGYAKAAGNVYSTKRIIQVCIWYTREGESGVSGAKVCSNAVDNYNWTPGPQVHTSAWDSLNPFVHTIFNISTVRIDPRLL